MRICLTCLVVAFMALGFSNTAKAQAPLSYTIEFDASDPAYGLNPSFNYQLMPLTITDSLNFSFDALSLTQLGTDILQTETILVYVFDINAELPLSPANQLEHLTHPDLVFHLTDGEPNAEGPVSPDLSTLENGQYQLIIAPFEPTGTSVDHELVFEIEGGVLLWIPLLETELGQIALAGATAGRLSVADAARIAGRQASASFSARRIGSGRDPGTSARGAPGLVGNVFLWVEMGGFRSEDRSQGSDVTGRSLQIGADVELAPDLLAGLSFGLDDISANGQGFSQTGTLRFVQPYLAYRSGHLGLAGSAVVGWGGLTQVSIGGTGSADTSLFAVNAEARYEFAGWADTVIVPALSLTHGWQEISGTGGTLAGAPADRVTFTSVSIGGDLVLPRLGWGEARLGLYADWSSEEALQPVSEELIGGEGWSGRLSLGLTAPVQSRGGVDASLEIGGIGADTLDLRGGLRINFRF